MSNEKGFNIWLYGPSGAGKSFTLGIGEKEKNISHKSGVIKIIVKEYFDRKAIENIEIKFLVAEVYKNNLFDLSSIEDQMNLKRMQDNFIQKELCANFDR